MISMPASERVALAEAVELNEQYLYQCFTGRRPLPAEHCPNVERASNARVTCEQMRPDVRWTRVPDPEWPHPGGRPCIDVAAPPKQAAADHPAPEPAAAGG